MLAEKYFSQYFGEKLEAIANKPATFSQVKNKYHANPKFQAAVTAKFQTSEQIFRQKYDDLCKADPEWAKYNSWETFCKNCREKLEDEAIKEIYSKEVLIMQNNQFIQNKNIIGGLTDQQAWLEFMNMKGMHLQGSNYEMFALSDEELQRIITQLPVDIALIAVSGGMGAMARNVVMRGISSLGSKIVTQGTASSLTSAIYRKGLTEFALSTVGLLAENTVFTASQSVFNYLRTGQLTLTSFEKFSEEWMHSLLMLKGLGAYGQVAQNLKMVKSLALAGELAGMGVLSGHVGINDVAMILGLKLVHGVSGKEENGVEKVEKGMVKDEGGGFSEVDVIDVNKKNGVISKNPARMDGGVPIGNTKVKGMIDGKIEGNREFKIVDGKLVLNRSAGIFRPNVDYKKTLLETGRKLRKNRSELNKYGFEENGVKLDFVKIKDKQVLSKYLKEAIRIEADKLRREIVEKQKNIGKVVDFIAEEFYSGRLSDLEAVKDLFEKKLSDLGVNLNQNEKFDLITAIAKFKFRKKLIDEIVNRNSGDPKRIFQDVMGFEAPGEVEFKVGIATISFIVNETFFNAFYEKITGVNNGEVFGGFNGAPTRYLGLIKAVNVIKNRPGRDLAEIDEIVRHEDRHGLNSIIDLYGMDYAALMMESRAVKSAKELEAVFDKLLSLELERARDEISAYLDQGFSKENIKRVIIESGNYDYWKHITEDLASSFENNPHVSKSDFNRLVKIFSERHRNISLRFIDNIFANGYGPGGVILRPIREGRPVGLKASLNRSPSSIEKVVEKKKFDPNDESFQTRVKANEALRRALDKLGLEGASPESRVEWLKSVSFDQFMNLLFYVNGKVRNMPTRQKWEGKFEKASVGRPGSLEMESPPDFASGIRSLFEFIKKNVNTENLTNYAGKIYIAIIFGHGFANGNGRTARIVYELLTDKKVTSDKIIERAPEINKFAIEVDDWAIKELCKDEGLLPKDFNDMMWNVDFDYTGPNMTFESGMMKYLMFLAARKSMKDTGVNVENLKQISYDELTPQQQLLFKQNYGYYRNLWFKKAVSVTNIYPDYVKNSLEAALKKPSSLDTHFKSKIVDEPDTGELGYINTEGEIAINIDAINNNGILKRGYKAEVGKKGELVIRNAQGEVISLKDYLKSAKDTPYRNSLINHLRQVKNHESHHRVFEFLYNNDPMFGLKMGEILLEEPELLILINID